MKTSSRLLLPGLLLLSALTTPFAFATDGKWNVNANGNWSTASNWTNSQIANGVGAVANIEFNFSAARTVTIDMPVTVGTIRYNDGNSTYYDFTLGVSGGNVLRLETASGSPTININRQTATFNAGLEGLQGFTKSGGGVLALSVASNNLSGPVILTAGDTRLKADATFGPEPATFTPVAITINGGTLVNNAADLTISANRGITLGSSGGSLLAGWTRPLTINSVISGAGKMLIRSDVTPGPITFNGANTYTGATTIGNTASASSWCWLLVNGSLAPESSVSVYTNASIGGTGAINGTVTVYTNGVVGPGGIFQAGTLTVNSNVAMNAGVLTYDLADVATEGGNVNDLLQVNGDLSLKGIITVSVNALNGTLANGTYRLINYTGTGDFSECTLVCENPRFGATFSTSGGQVNMTIANGMPAHLTWTGAGGNFWDIGTTENFLKGTTPDVFYQGDVVTFDNDGVYDSPVTLVADGPNMGMVRPGAVVVIADKDFTLTSTSGGKARLGGSMSLYKGGSGIMTLSLGNTSNPNMYEGLTLVTNGTLKIGNARVLGSTQAGTIVTNLGQFDTGGQGDVYDPMTLEGSGPDGSGVVVNTGSGTSNNGLRAPVTLAGDVTFGGSGRWDIYGTTLAGNGHKITKKGANEIALSNLGETGVGEIDVNEGQLTILGTTRATMDGSKVTVTSNAVFAFWGMYNSAADPFIKDVTVENANFRGNSGTNFHSGTVRLHGTNGITAVGQFSLLGPLLGTGGVRKQGAGLLMLEGQNSYSGPTFVDAGTMALGPAATLAFSSPISIASGATFDVAQLAGGFLLADGQILAGAGTVTGNVGAGPGSTIIPGTSPATLTINGTLALTNATLVYELGSNPASGNDQITAAGLAASGVNTIKIVPLATLDASNPYTLIQNTGAALPAGSEANFKAVTDSRYNFTVIPTETSGSGVQIKVDGLGAPAMLTWKGADPVNPTAWDLQGTSNWLNGAVSDKFFAGDTVVFDDSAAGTIANLVGTIQPAAVVLSNANKAITIGGAGALVTPGLTVEGSGTTTIANSSANVFAQGIQNNGGTLVIANSGANDYGPGLTINSGKVVVDQGINSTITAPLFGSGEFEKNNTNVLTLGGASTAPVAITVNNGILRAGSTTAFGAYETPLTIKPGASLDVNGLMLSNKVVSVSGAGFNDMGAIINTGANQGYALQKIMLTGDTVFGGNNVWDLRGFPAELGSLTTLSDAVYKITKIGPQRFSIVNIAVGSNLGDIDVREGVFSYEDFCTSLGNPTNTVTVSSNAFFTLYRMAYPLDKKLRLLDCANLRVANGTSNYFVGPVEVVSGQANIISATSYALYMLGSIGGEGGLAKGEAGSVHLVGSNYFKGDVDVNLGNLVLSNNYAAGTKKTVNVNYNTTVSGGAGVRLYLRGGVTIPDDVVGHFTSFLSGAIDYRTSITSDNATTNTWSGPVVLEGSGITAFYGGPANSLNVTGPLFGTNGFTGRALFRATTAGYCGRVSSKVDLGAGSFELTDNAIWEVTNPANSWAKTALAYGRLMILADDAACPTAAVVMGQEGSASLSAGTLDVNGYNQTILSVSTVNGANHFFTNGSALADSVLTYDGNTNVSTFNGKLVDGTRNLALTVRSGALILSGANTYKGNTRIDGGTLAVGAAGSISTTPVITLAAGARLDSSGKGDVGLTLAAGQTLTGTGTVDGSITVGSGGTLSVGSSIGAMTITNILAIAAGGTNVVEINSSASAASDSVNAGSVTYGGVLMVNNLGPALAVGNTFKLFTAGSYAGAFTQIIPETPGSGLRWDVSGLLVDGTLKVAPAVSTEPAPIATLFKASGMELSWPADHTGWRLEVQTNALSIGLSNNWQTVEGSDLTNSVSVQYDASTNAVFYRLVYP